MTNEEMKKALAKGGLAAKVTLAHTLAIFQAV